MVTTVLTISIVDPGNGYVNGSSKLTMNDTHGETQTLLNLYVDIIVDSNGSIISAIPTEGKTGIDYNVNDLVFIQPTVKTKKLCILKVDSIAQ